MHHAFPQIEITTETMDTINDAMANPTAQVCFLCSSCKPARAEVSNGKFTQ